MFQSRFTCKSPRDEAKEYSNIMEVNWIKEYSTLSRYNH
jgi:hypothetical protein